MGVLDLQTRVMALEPTIPVTSRRLVAFSAQVLMLVLPPRRPSPMELSGLCPTSALLWKVPSLAGARAECARHIVCRVLAPLWLTPTPRGPGQAGVAALAQMALGGSWRAQARVHTLAGESPL